MHISLHSSKGNMRECLFFQASSPDLGERYLILCCRRGSLLTRHMAILAVSTFPQDMRLPSRGDTKLEPVLIR